MKLCEKMGQRLRRSGNYAQGIEVNCSFMDHTWWHKAQKTTMILYSSHDLHAQAMPLLESLLGKKVTHLGVSCYGLKPMADVPLTLFDTDVDQRIRIAAALDECNNEYGEYAVHPVRMMGMEGEVIKRVPFHATTDTLSEIYYEDELQPA